MIDVHVTIKFRQPPAHCKDSYKNFITVEDSKNYLYFNNNSSIAAYECVY